MQVERSQPVIDALGAQRCTAAGASATAGAIAAGRTEAAGGSQLRERARLVLDPQLAASLAKALGVVGDRLGVLALFDELPRECRANAFVLAAVLVALSGSGLGLGVDGQAPRETSPRARLHECWTRAACSSIRARLRSPLRLPRR